MLDAGLSLSKSQYDPKISKMIHYVQRRSMRRLLCIRCTARGDIAMEACKHAKASICNTSALFDGFLPNRNPSSPLGTDVWGVLVSKATSVTSTHSVGLGGMNVSRVSSSCLQKGSVGRTSLLPPGWIHHDQLHSIDPCLASTPGQRHKNIRHQWSQ